MDIFSEFWLWIGIMLVVGIAGYSVKRHRRNKIENQFKDSGGGSDGPPTRLH